MRSFVLVVLITLLPLACLAQAKKAMKAIEKNEWQEAEEALLKGFEKDSLDPLGYHVFSILLSDGRAPQFDIDKASDNNQYALTLFNSLDDKEKAKLEKAELTTEILERQGNFIDSIAFLVSLQKNTEQGFNHFIEKYPSAPQLNKAIAARNNIAYQAAQKENSIESYRGFLKKYPAADQATRAQEELDKLLYEQQAKNAGLQQMINFLNQYPDNPYRKEVEFNVFKSMVGFFNEENLINFTKALPESELSQLAFDFLYHLQPYDERKNFLNKYPSYKKSDSLRLIIKGEDGFLIPLISEGKYGFINNSGDVIIEPHIESIDESLKCSIVAGDLIEILESGQTKILNRLQTLIYQSDLDSIKDLGNGFIRISRQGKQGLVHKSGYVFFEPSYRDIELVYGSILKFRRAESWGLMDPFQNIILEDNLSSISNFGNIVSLEKNSRIGLYRIEDLFNLNSVLLFKYDEVEQLNSGNFLCFLDDQEELLSSNLSTIIPLGNHQINSFNEVWLTEGDLFTQVIDGQGKLIIDSIARLSVGDHLMGYKKNSRWHLYTPQGIDEVSYDSIRFVSDDLYIFFSGKKRFLNFQGDNRLDLDNTGSYRVLQQNQNPQGKSFLLTFDKDGVKRLYNSNGNKILAGWFDEVTPINDFLFLIDEKNKKGLSDSTGNNVLPIEYDGVGKYDEGLIPTLKKGKFGAFIYPSKQIIEPEYDIQPKPFGDSMVLVSKKGRYGIVNHRNKEVLPVIYDQIELWSGNQVLIRNKNSQYIRDLGSPDSVSFTISTASKLPNGEEFIVFSTKEGVGVMDINKLELVKPVFNRVNVLTRGDEIVFACGQYLPETDLYVLAYFDKAGKLVWRNSVSQKDYEANLCQPQPSASGSTN